MSRSHCRVALATLLCYAAFVQAVAFGQPTASSITLNASVNPVTYGQPVTLTATVTSGATGKVTFYDGVTVLGIAPISGTQAAFTTRMLSSGTRSLWAHYSGDAAYAASNSAKISETVVAGVSLGFQLPVTYPTASSPEALASADFNGDGKTDLVVASYGTGSVSVLLGIGDGTFRAAVNYNVGITGPPAVAVGDFNGDGKADLAVVAYANSTYAVEILLGNGDGTFQNGVNYPVDNSATSLALADFNGDGLVDLAVGNQNTGRLDVLLGKGDGTFNSALSYTTSVIPLYLAVGDFNNDGKADVVAVSTGYVDILLGNGDGTFQSDSVTNLTYISIRAVSVADFNGDGNADLVVAAWYGGSQILLGNGDGTVRNGISIGVYGEVSVLTEDWNGDGNVDIVLGSIYNPYNLIGAQLWTGNGNGGFQAGDDNSPSLAVYGLAAGDFNGDGIIDLAAGEYNNSGVAVFLGGATPDLTIAMTHGSGLTQGQTGAAYSITVSNQGQVASFGSVGVTVTLPAGFAATAISGSGWTCVLGTLACVRSDSVAVGAGFPAITVTVNVPSTTTGNVTATATVSGGGDGNFSNNTASDTAFARYATTTTLSVTGYGTSGQAPTVSMTATVTSGATGQVTFYDGATVLAIVPLSSGQAVFATALLPTGLRSLRARYDGDATYGPSSSAVWSQYVTATSASGFQAGSRYQFPVAPSAIAVGDFNRDGKSDIVTVHSGSSNGTVNVMLGNGNGTFQAPKSSPIANNPYPNYIAVADFNGDGNPDVAFTSSSGYGLSVMLGNGDGTFQAAVKYGSTNAYYVGLLAGDFNGDGQVDLAVLNNSTPTVFLGNGDGTFQAPITITNSGSSASYSFLAVADLNNDGKADLVALTYGQVSVFISNGDGTFQTPVTYSDNNISSPYNLLAGDFNRDGKMDMAVVYWVGADIFLGAGDGTLLPQVRSSLSYTPGSLAVAADFDGDLNLDIATAGYYVSRFYVSLGRGDGSLQYSSSTPANAFQTDSTPVGLATADFNGDGRTDIAVANGGSANLATVQVFLGGQFVGLIPAVRHTDSFIAGRTASYQITVSNPRFIATSGTVQVSDTLPAGMTATAMSGAGWTCTLGTLICTRSDALTNNGAYPQITLTVSISGSLSPATLTNYVYVSYGGAGIWANDPTAVVSATAVSLAASPNPSSLGQTVTLTASVTGGGGGTVIFFDNGVTIGSAAVSGGVAVLTTNALAAGTRTLRATYSGDTTHGPSSSALLYQTVSAAATSGEISGASPATGAGPSAIAQADLNRDGKTDLVTVNTTANTISVLLGNGNGTFAAKVDYPVGTAPKGIVIADFNNDGKPDLATVNSAGYNIGVLLGNGDGTFQPAVNSVAGGTPNALIAGDFNGDGKLDLVVSNSNTYTTSLFLGNGDGTFQSGTAFYSYSATAFAVGDFNGDGKADLALLSYSPYILLGNGDGTFQSSIYVPANGYSLTGLAAGDLNGDHKLDLILVGYNGAYVCLGNGDGTFQAGSVQYQAGTNPSGVAIADVNGDGKLDAIVANNSSNNISVLFGNGNGTLQTAINYASGTSPSGVVAGDFNNDGRTDIAASNSGSSSVSVWLGVLTPVLTVTSSHPGAFYAGQTGAAYLLTVTNFGPGITSGTITVADTLPAGLTATSIAGAGWICDLASLTCARSDSLAVGASYPAITLRVNVTASAGSMLTNTVNVSGGGSPSTNANDSTTISSAPTALRFVPIIPCRIADTRNTTGSFGGPQIASGSSRSFPIPSGGCNIPATALGYSLNVTVVPAGPLGYVTVWPTGQTQPLASTLNSLDGRIKSNAALIPAGANGAISVFASNATHVILDINGYFVPATDPTALAFYPITPCRIADTRKPIADLGGPSLAGGQGRTFPILSASACNIPASAQAYSLNFAAVPKGALGYITAWPTGQSQPVVSTLNAPTGAITANAAIVPAGTSGAINVFASNATDLVIDINGYFAPADTGGLSLYSITPCRVLDTRQPAGSAAFNGQRDVDIAGSACGVPGGHGAYVFSATVVPSGTLGYLTLWPQGQSQPVVSTLNALDGAITSNLALVPADNGNISAWVANPTHLILDISGYFAQ